MAMAMVARAHLQVAHIAGATPLRVSFGRTLSALQPLWMLLNVGDDLVSAEQQKALIERVLAQLAGRLLPDLAKFENVANIKLSRRSGSLPDYTTLDPVSAIIRDPPICRYWQRLCRRP